MRMPSGPKGLSMLLIAYTRKEQNGLASWRLRFIHTSAGSPVESNIWSRFTLTSAASRVCCTGLEKRSSIGIKLNLKHHGSHAEAPERRDNIWVVTALIGYIVVHCAAA